MKEGNLHINMQYAYLWKKVTLQCVPDYSRRFGVRTSRNKPCKGPSIQTSEEYSEYTTQLLCSDPESPLALSFKEWNFKKETKVDHPVFCSKSKTRSSCIMTVNIKRTPVSKTSILSSLERKISKIVCTSRFRF